MTGNEYKYLFPFETVTRDSSILIYGAGIVGMEYAKQIEVCHYCKIIGFIDKNYAQYRSFAYKVYAPEDVHGLMFDYIVIAQRVETYIEDITRSMKRQGVEENKIIFVPPREKPGLSVRYENEDKHDTAHCAFALTGYCMAVHVAGGIGDYVIQKKVVEEFIRLLPSWHVDLYYTKHGKFLGYLYSDCEEINAVIPDLGIRYECNMQKYDLAIDILSTRYIHIDLFRPERILQYDAAVFAVIKKFSDAVKKENATDQTLPYVLYHRRMYKGLNAYTFWGYGMFHFDSASGQIPLVEQAKKTFDSFGIKNYVTINYGCGAFEEASMSSKMWPEQYFNEFVKLFKRKYPSLKVVQLGKENARKLIDADRYILGSEFEVVVHVLKNARLHIDIEGGLVHIATRLGTKCVVLFGPTPKEYFAYDNNINIAGGGCCDCYGLYASGFQCARGLSVPECMERIKPQHVMDCVDSYFHQNMCKTRVR